MQKQYVYIRRPEIPNFNEKVGIYQVIDTTLEVTNRVKIV